MSSVADSLIASAARNAALRRRPDIQAVRHVYQGRGCWVLKDPVGLKYSRLFGEEYAIFNMLDGRTSYEQIQERFEAKFTPQKLEFQHLHQLTTQLHTSGLLISDHSGQGKHLFQRHKEQVWKQWTGVLANVFAIRWKGIDPDWLLTWLYRYTWWFFTWPAVLACVLMGLAALLLVTVQFETFQSRLPTFHTFFGPANWIYLGITLGAVKVLHEFGHGLACKHYKGECHEMGFMLLVFTPALFCNVSDSWMLRSKWSRMAVGAAGMYVEMVLASLATFIWWTTEQGLLHNLCLSVMFVCSVSTLMFNGNPLLRFDGYYILADYMEIPNMRQKATEVLRRWFFVHCLGMDLPEDPFLPKRNRLFMAVFTVAAALYRWVVTFSILLFISKALEPYGLQVAGRLLGLVGLFGLVVQPAYQMYKFFRIPGRWHEMKRPRLITTLSILTIALLLFAFLPLPYHVTCPLEVARRDASSVYITRPGQLTEVLVKPGDPVKTGDLLARLTNVDMELQLAQLERERDVLLSRQQMLQHSRFEDSAALAQLPLVNGQLEILRQRIGEVKTNMQELELRAPSSGVVLPAPAKPTSHDENQLPGWTGAVLDADNANAWLQPGDLFCQIGDAGKTEAVMVIDQTEIELVEPRQYVRVKLNAYPGVTYEGYLDRIAPTDMKALPPNLSQQAGGELATKASPTGQPQPLHTAYQARVQLNNSRSLLQPGFRGRAKISTQWRSLGSRTYRYLIRTFHFDF